MYPGITDARYKSGHRIWVCFSDGIQGEVDLSDELSGPMFEPLQNLDVFRARVPAIEASVRGVKLLHRLTAQPQD